MLVRRVCVRLNEIILKVYLVEDLIDKQCVKVIYKWMELFFCFFFVGRYIKGILIIVYEGILIDSDIKLKMFIIVWLYNESFVVEIQQVLDIVFK